MSRHPSVVDALVRRDRVVVAAALLAVCTLAWIVTAGFARTMAGTNGMDDMPDMQGMPGMDMSAPAWTFADFGLVAVMWAVMMAAMMLPASIPMLTVFAIINRRRREQAAPYVGTAVFLAGYLMAWSSFGIIATLAQWQLTALGLVSPMMASRSPLLTVSLFVVAGLYQLSAFKDACLSRCRSPAGFVLSEWRDGAAGALLMGLRHGLFCIGCCAVLMLLLFAVAVMDLRWVAALAVLVSIEKLLPYPRFWRRAIAAALIAAGAVVLAVPRLM